MINEAANLYKDSPVIEGNFSVSSPKLDLKFADGSGSPGPYLSSLISSTSANKKSVTLNLDYVGQYIEQEISELNGIDGYKPSSWLSFVEDTSKKWPLKVELGQFEVPIVLRAFPLTPTLIRQREILDSKKTILSASDVQLRESLPSEPDCTRTGDYNPFSKISKWKYGIEYSIQVHYPQEAIHATISFNVLDRKKLGMAADPERDLFDNLAEFIEEFPKVKSDLDNYLAPIDVNLDAKSKTAINAESALESAAVLINWIAGSFNQLGKVQDRFEINAGRNVPPVKLIVTEDGVERTYPDGRSINALQITVALDTPLPAGIGKPFVEIDGYVCIPDPAGGDDKKFPYLYTKDGSYLPAETAATIPQRELILQDLEILERQDAQTEIYLTQNEELIPGKMIAGPFVYTTPTVSFPGPSPSNSVL